MHASLQTNTAPWQGLRLSRTDANRDELSDPASWVAEELAKLGGSAPVTVLLLAMERHNYDRPHELLIDALTDEPDAFAWSAV